MGALSTATSRNDYRQETFHAKPGLVVPEAKIRADFQKPNIRAKPKRVTETEYWDKYYEHTDAIYEWNNGLLEDKPVSDHENTLMYLWFVELLREFLRVHRVANLTALEMGFRLNLPDKTVIRRPDLGVVLTTTRHHFNPTSAAIEACVICASKSFPIPSRKKSNETPRPNWVNMKQQVLKNIIFYTPKGHRERFTVSTNWACMYPSNEWKVM